MCVVENGSKFYQSRDITHGGCEGNVLFGPIARANEGSRSSRRRAGSNAEAGGKRRRRCDEAATAAPIQIRTRADTTPTPRDNAAG